jgi:hypothetical protein
VIMAVAETCRSSPKDHARHRLDSARRGLLGARLDGHDRTITPGNASTIADTMSRIPKIAGRHRAASPPPSATAPASPTDDHEVLNDFAGPGTPDQAQNSDTRLGAARETHKRKPILD